MADVRKASGTDGPRGVVYEFSRARDRVAVTESAPDVDSAGITDTARELNKARAAVESSPDTRMERVQALKKQIQNGTYQPDPKEIARQILDRGF
jgi:negative regulator of flagellin synthesis FlgM